MTHLRKREVSERQDNDFDPRYLVFEDERETAPVIECGLDEPAWSVVSFDKLEASQMTYEQAVKLLNALNATGISGLCVVTDAAARRSIRN